LTNESSSVSTRRNSLSSTSRLSQPHQRNPLRHTDLTKSYYCHGTLNARLTAPKGKRGVVRVTVTSFGFTGSGTGWKKNPRCTVVIGTSHISAIAFNEEHFFAATFGPRRGVSVSRDIVTGSGLVQFGVIPYTKNSPVRARQGYGVGFFVLVP
ncbi:hypothetical protein, partial [Gordonia mangrovi]|uniref:hypothetical protein n=1 Tax=Gordonia mangrovi TaxID=2665643 RepID=UPI001F416223